MNRLKAMFAVVGLALVSGTVYTVAVLRPGFGVADVVDAGILQVSVPMQLQCSVRIRDVCRRPDGGVYPKYALVNLKARKWTPDSGTPYLLVDVPDAPDRSGSCVVPVGTMGEACRVLEDGACTDPQVCCATCEPVGVQNPCACRPATGTCTRADGGVAPFGVTLASGTWAGAGCVRKYCGPEIAGEQGGSWPSVCPGG